MINWKSMYREIIHDDKGLTSDGIPITEIKFEEI